MQRCASSPADANQAAARRGWPLLLLLATAWLAASCRHAPPALAAAPLPAAAGQPAPVVLEAAPLPARPRWWNYYQRSLQYALAGDWERAALDLEIALGRRRGVPFGEDQEKRRAKTYGLHYLDDYFPHRELGICRFHLGHLEAAEQELLLSLRMLPSSRAKFYLNEVRHARLQSATAPVLPAFTIELQPSTDPWLTNRLRVELEGTITSAAFVAHVSVNGSPLFVELATPVYPLTAALSLVPGEQQVLVDAEDLQGRRARASLRVVVDLAGPEIALTRPPDGGADEVLVTVTDDRELASVALDGRALALAPGQASVSSRVSSAGRGGVTVVAVDRAGNRTALGKGAAARDQAARGAASSDWLLAGERGPLQWRGAAGAPLLLAQAAPPAEPSPADTLPPVLQLFPPPPPQITVTSDVYVVDLQVEDSGGVAAVTFVLNGRQETREFQPADATMRRLTRSLQLLPGRNELEVVARDRAGNLSRRQLLIEQRTDRAWRDDLRVTSQALPPIPPPSAPPATMPAVDLYPLLLEALTQHPARLNLVERDPAVMQRLIQEHHLSQSPLADTTYAIRSGKLRSADWCLVSRVTVWPGQDNFDLFVEVVDVAETEILLTADMHFSSTEREHLRFQLRGLVAKLEQQLPRLTAPVRARAGQTLILPLGAEQQVLRGMYVLFVPATADPSEYAEPITWQNGAWVQGRVTRVLKDSCRVAVEPAKALGLIQARDLALFR